MSHTIKVRGIVGRSVLMQPSALSYLPIGISYMEYISEKTSLGTLVMIPNLFGIQLVIKMGAWFLLPQKISMPLDVSTSL